MNGSDNLARNVVGRGVVRLVDDARRMQEAQLSVLDDETIAGAERFQEYGFTSHPQPGAEMVSVFVGADRSHPIVVACDDRRFRIAGLQPGEVCLYTDEGDAVTLRRGHVIEVSTEHVLINAAADVTVATGETTINAPGGVTINADVLINGSITWTGTAQGRGGAARFLGGLVNEGGDVHSNGVTLESHVHGGVTPGGGSSGQPL